MKTTRKNVLVRSINVNTESRKDTIKVISDYLSTKTIEKDSYKVSNIDIITNKIDKDNVELIFVIFYDYDIEVESLASIIISITRFIY